MNFLKEMKKISSDESYSKNYVTFFDYLLVLLKKEKVEKDSEECFAFIDYNNKNRFFYVPKGVSNTILSDFYMKTYVFPFEKGNLFFQECDKVLKFNENAIYYNIFREYLKIQKFCYNFTGETYFGNGIKTEILKLDFFYLESDVNYVIDNIDFIKLKDLNFLDLVRLSYDCLSFDVKDKCLLHDFSTVDYVKFFIEKYDNQKDLQFQKLIQMFFVGSEWTPQTQIHKDNSLYLNSSSLFNNTGLILIEKANVIK